MVYELLGIVQKIFDPKPKILKRRKFLEFKTISLTCYTSFDSQSARELINFPHTILGIWSCLKAPQLIGRFF